METLSRELHQKMRFRVGGVATVTPRSAATDTRLAVMERTWPGDLTQSDEGQNRAPFTLEKTFRVFSSEF